jgi:hypothetical protein
MDHWVGADFGSHVDPSAVSVLTRSLSIGADGRPCRDSRGWALYDWRLRAIERFPLRTSYAVVARQVAAIAAMPELDGPRVVVDATGVGQGVLEMLRTELAPYPAIQLWGVSITAGEAFKMVGMRMMNVSKVALIGAFAAALHSGRFRVSRDEHGRPIRNADLFEKELAAFKVRQSRRSEAEIFGADSGQHDDMVLSASLPTFVGSLPFAEMTTIGESRGRLRPGESAAMSAESRAIRDAEEEAIRLERDRPRGKALDNEDLWS